MTTEIKDKLDKIIQKHAIKIVGTGYIDIIVSRENYSDFITELTLLDIPVVKINWWCCTIDSSKENTGCPHGAGGPQFDGGYYGEFYWIDDDYKLNKNNSIKQHNSLVKESIENKTLNDRDGNLLTFKQNKCLTPGIRLDISEKNLFIDNIMN